MYDAEDSVLDPPNTTELRPETTADRTAKNLPTNKGSGPGEVASSSSNVVESAATAAPVRRHFGRRILLAVLALAVMGGGAAFGNYWWTSGRFYVSTDDAYVGARNATLSPKVSGYITEIAFADNAQVKAGDPIVRIDDVDYKLAVASAKDQIATQKATISRLGKQVVAQMTAVDQAKAQLASAKAGETRTDLELKRQKDLATRQFSSQQTLEQAQANYAQAVAAVQSAEAAVAAAVANVDVLKAQQQEAERGLDQLETALARAERDLSFTVVRAPFDGVIGNRAVQVGDYVQPNQRLASLVPLEAVYIDANFKETQLSRLQPGQPVTIAVDALPGKTFEGRVESFAPASGSVFSLLPPDNATGNFTKIVQRLPVRIQVPGEVAEQSVLRPGMSVVVSVNTKPGAAGPTAPMNTAEIRRSKVLMAE